MCTHAQFWYAEAQLTRTIVAEVVLKVVVQVVCLVYVTVYYQFQVVAYAAARCVDTAVVVELGYEVWCGVTFVWMIASGLFLYKFLGSV